jgi:hypothetical protein
VPEKNMGTFKRMACIVVVAVCLAPFPHSAFGEFEKNPIIHSAKRALADLKRLQTSCEVGLAYSEYARVLDEVQNEVNKLDEHFARHAEEILTWGLMSLPLDISTGNLLANLHYIMSLHEVVKGWWKRLIEKRNDPICLDLMLSDEWEEITLLLEDASEHLERMRQSSP